MCSQVGTAVSVLDRVTGKLHGFIVCGCGRTEIPVSLDPTSQATYGTSYVPNFKKSA